MDDASPATAVVCSLSINAVHSARQERDLVLAKRRPRNVVLRPAVLPDDQGEEAATSFVATTPDSQRYALAAAGSSTSRPLQLT